MSSVQSKYLREEWFRRKKDTSHDSKNCIKSRKHKIKNKYIGDAIMTYPTFPESKKKKILRL